VLHPVSVFHQDVEEHKLELNKFYNRKKYEKAKMIQRYLTSSRKNSKNRDTKSCMELTLRSLGWDFQRNYRLTGSEILTSQVDRVGAWARR